MQTFFNSHEVDIKEQGARAAQGRPLEAAFAGRADPRDPIDSFMKAVNRRPRHADSKCPLA